VRNAVLDVVSRVRNSVSAVVEYEFLRRNTRQELPVLSEHGGGLLAERIERLCAGQHQYETLSLQATGRDAVMIPPALRDSTAWNAFIKRIDASAQQAGFGSEVSAGLAGAVAELADNVVLHSEASSSGVAAFAGGPGWFEYAVADAGVGMLESLSRAPEYRSLRDDIEALQLAVTAGVSCRGRDKGFGYGYRTVLLPLRAAQGAVRLRSGSAVLQVVGSGPGPDRVRCVQRAEHRGVVVSAKISALSGGRVDKGDPGG